MKNRILQPGRPGILYSIAYSRFMDCTVTVFGSLFLYFSYGPESFSFLTRLRLGFLSNRDESMKFNMKCGYTNDGFWSLFSKFKLEGILHLV